MRGEPVTMKACGVGPKPDRGWSQCVGGPVSCGAILRLY